MADFISGTSGEVLTLHESENIPYIQSIESTISNGTYVKLTNQQFIFQNMSQVKKIDALSTPQYMGIVNNNTILNFEVSRNEV
jgi:hypothetical protein